jgi:2-oxoisovalerate dehydrogenase E2 component (dihydrolipoyl transacylase)
VPVGTPIISIGDPSAAPAPAPAAPAADLSEMDLSNPAATGGGEGESLVGRNKAERAPMRRPRLGSASPSTESAAATQMQVQGAFAAGGAQSQAVIESDEPAVPSASARVVTPAQPSEFVPASATTPSELRALAKPPVRKLAKDLGVDLSTVTPTGPNGTVSRDDVEGAASGTSSGGRDLSPRPYDVAPGARETREPIKGVRKMMAGAMVSSAFTAPHVTEWITVDVTATMEFVERLKKRREFKDVKVSPLLVLTRAVILAMRRTPEINSFWDEAAQEVVYKHYVNLGIAAATPRGLVVPNVKDADALSLLELGGALNQLTATARDGKTQPAEMAGGTFTITNVGVFGVDAGTPIINPGESAILCFGAVRKQPWVVSGAAGDEIAIRQITTLALSFDHRHIDGEKGSRFLADVAGILEDPASALLF